MFRPIRRIPSFDLSNIDTTVRNPSPTTTGMCFTPPASPLISNGNIGSEVFEWNWTQEEFEEFNFDGYDSLEILQNDQPKEEFNAGDIVQLIPKSNLGQFHKYGRLTGKIKSFVRKTKKRAIIQWQNCPENKSAETRHNVSSLRKSPTSVSEYPTFVNI